MTKGGVGETLQKEQKKKKEGDKPQQKDAKKLTKKDGKNW